MDFICKRCDISITGTGNYGYCHRCVGLLLDSIHIENPTDTAKGSEDTDIDRLIREIMETIRPDSKGDDRYTLESGINKKLRILLSKYGYSPLVPLDHKRKRELKDLIMDCEVKFSKGLNVERFSKEDLDYATSIKKLYAMIESIGTKQVDIRKVAEDIDDIVSEYIGKEFYVGNTIYHKVKDIEAILTKYFIG